VTEPRADFGWSRRALLATAGATVLGACGVEASKEKIATPTHPPPPAGTSAATTTTPAPVRAATYVANGSRNGTSVALTFHGSGDVGLTRQLLAEATQQSAPLTVFAVGTWLEANPTIGRQILDGGHSLGNHTYTHPDLGRLGGGAVADEIQRCATVLEQLEGSNGHWFRPSGIVVPSALILEQAGLAGYPVSVGYDVDPLDYQDPEASAIVARVAQALRPGSIVSLHTGHAGTVAAFPAIVELIRGRNLEPVLIGDLVRVPPSG
jgi:peptidoglycan/xylan/chitin deacetylase (PgdA/CDA1 family)